MPGGLGAGLHGMACIAFLVIFLGRVLGGKANVGRSSVWNVVHSLCLEVSMCVVSPGILFFRVLSAFGQGNIRKQPEPGMIDFGYYATLKSNKF